MYERAHTTAASSSRNSRTDGYPTLQQLASASPGDLGAEPSVSVAEFTTVIRAGNAAHLRRHSMEHERRVHLSGQRMQVAAPPSRLLSERLALASLGLSLDGTPNRALEAGWNGAMYEEDEDAQNSLDIESSSHHPKLTHDPRHGGDEGGPTSKNSERRASIQQGIEANAHTSQEPALPPRRVGRLRRQGKFSLPSRGSLDLMDHHVNEVEWRHGFDLTKMQMGVAAGDLVANPEDSADPPEPETMVIPQNGERLGFQLGKQVERLAGDNSGLLTVNRDTTTPSFLKYASLAGQNRDTPAGRQSMVGGDRQVYCIPLGDVGESTPAVLVPGRAAFPMSPMSNLGLAAGSDDDDATPRGSFTPVYVDDDDRSLFLPPSAAQRRARANAMFLPPLPEGVAGRTKGDPSHRLLAGSSSLVPTVFDNVRVPSSPTGQRIAEPTRDDRATILPSAQRRTRQEGFGGVESGNKHHHHHHSTAVRRRRGRSAQLEPGPPVLQNAPSSAGLELASAMAACRMVTAETSMPAILVPGVPRAPPRAQLAPERHDSIRVLEEDEQWLLASEESGSPRYGEFPCAAGDDWKARWMRYEGDFR